MISTKNRRRNFHLLWNESKNSSIKTYEQYCSKLLSDFCRSVDQCENIQSYVKTLCSEVVKLIDLSIPEENIRKNKIVFQKIQSLGEDIMEVSQVESDQYFLGAFIDIKIVAKWYDSKFYDVISSLFSKIQNSKIVIPMKIKRKLIEFIKYHRTSYDTLGYTYKNAD